MTVAFKLHYMGLKLFFKYQFAANKKAAKKRLVLCIYFKFTL